MNKQTRYLFATIVLSIIIAVSLVGCGSPSVNEDWLAGAYERAQNGR